MRKYLNGASVPLSMAVFLATDTYDHDSTTVSVTKLMKPLRQLILASRVPPEEALVDISTLVKSRVGSAIHDAIERSWLEHKEKAMLALGYPKRVIERVKVNPDPDTIGPDDIPVYLEQRAYKEVNGVTISGKFDFVAEGRVEDFKSTSVYTFTSNNKTEDYQLQGSLYRWLNPKIITKNEMAINFLLTDWQSNRATPQVLIPLLSVHETEVFVQTKLEQLSKHKDSLEHELPLCTDKDLWRTGPVFKYYANPEKTSRATKNFGDDRIAAYTYLSQQGKGIVKEVPGEVRACMYCPGFSICTQKDALIADGSLKI
jgi:hypothetical protein